MRSETATTRRVRLVIVLSVAAAVTVMIGAILVAAGPVMRMVTKRQPAHLTRLGLDVIAAGIAFGLVVLVVFGPQKLPELARSFGKLMAEFRKASNDFKNAFEEEMRDLERQARIAELKKQVAEANAAATAATDKPAETPATLATPPSPPSEPTTPAPENGVPVVNPVAEAIPR